LGHTLAVGLCDPSAGRSSESGCSAGGEDAGTMSLLMGGGIVVEFGFGVDVVLLCGEGNLWKGADFVRHEAVRVSCDLCSHFALMLPKDSAKPLLKILGASTLLAKEVAGVSLSSAFAEVSVMKDAFVSCEVSWVAASVASPSVGQSSKTWSLLRFLGDC